MMWTSSHIYGTYITSGEDASFQFPSSGRILCILVFFYFEFLYFKFVFLLGVYFLEFEIVIIFKIGVLVWVVFNFVQVYKRLLISINEGN